MTAPGTFLSSISFLNTFVRRVRRTADMPAASGGADTRAACCAPARPGVSSARIARTSSPIDRARSRKRAVIVFSPRRLSWTKHPHRLAGEPGLHVLERLPVEDPVTLLGDIAEMRRDDRTRKIAQGMIERQRLLVVHVEPRAGELALAKRGDERGFVDDWAARRVDQIGRRLHQGELASADELARAVAEHQVNAHDVGARQ